MDNKRLKSTVLRVVNNQLRMNDPECTKKTYERLINSGYNTKQAKEMIASVLLEEMFDIMQDQKKFDERKYAEKLQKLGATDTLEEDVMFMDDTGSINNQMTPIEDIVEQIEYNHGFFPEEILNEIIQRKDEAIPVLLNILEQVGGNPENYVKKSDYFAHIYASFLLAQFRETRAYPLIVKLISTEGNLPFDLFGDTITEDMDKILASVCGGDISLISKVIENASLDEYVRGAALRSLLILVKESIVDRNEIISYLKDLYNAKLERRESHVWGELVDISIQLYPEEVYPEMMKAIKEEFVDEPEYFLEEVEKTLRMDKQEVLAALKSNDRLELIDDTITSLKWWACFKNEMPRMKTSSAPFQAVSTKVGRNNPCPCGSGKKYKKCCGK